MKSIPQYKVIGPYNYDRTGYRSDKWKDAFSFKIKNCAIR